MIQTLVILAVAAALFVYGKPRADLVAISALMALMLTGILTPAEGLAGFSSSIVMLLIGVFVVGGAVSRTGLAKRVSRNILALAGTSQNRLFILIMLVTSGIGAFVSNTGTVAIMMPIVVGLAAGAGTSPSRYLMPLAFASTLGGMLTLIGTTPNMIISNALVGAGHAPLSFFAFLPIGVICVAVGTVTLLFMSKWLVKPETGDTKAGAGMSLKELADTYQLKQTEFRARIRPGSLLVGKTPADFSFRDDYEVTLVEIRRKRQDKTLFGKAVHQIMPQADTVFQTGDTFSFLLPTENLGAFANAFALDIIDETDAASRPEFKYAFDEVGIAEVVVLATSRLVGRTVRDAGFFEQYHARILGVRRGDVAMLTGIEDRRIQAGDALLVQASWDDIARLEDEHTEWVVVGRPLEAASSQTLDHKAPLCGLIVLLMIGSMVFNLLEPVLAVMLAALTLIFTGCFRTVEEAYKTISWQSVVLIGAMLPVAAALEKTGAAGLASSALNTMVGGAGPYALLAAVYGMASFTTLFVSNTAAGALCTPIALQAALSMGYSPYPFLFGVATAASMSLAFPFSTPPNVLVMAPGRYVFMDYVKVGAPLQVLIGVIMVLVLPVLWPFAG